MDEPIFYEFGRSSNNGFSLDISFESSYRISTKTEFELDPILPTIRSDLDEGEVNYEIENVTKRMFDGMNAHYHEKKCDHLFHALFPDHTPTSSYYLEEGSIITFRNPIRRLFNAFITNYLSEKVHRFYTIVKDFSLFVEKVNSILIVSVGNERNEEYVGGYGEGLKRFLLKKEHASSFFDEDDTLFQKPSSSTAVAKEMEEEEEEESNYYRVNANTLGELKIILSYQIDSVNEENKTIEIKSVKINPRFPNLSSDFYLSLWAQNHFGNTKKTILGYHDGKGNVKKIVKLTDQQVQSSAKLNYATKKAIFEHLEHFFQWIRASVPDNHQALITFDKEAMSFKLEIQEDFKLPVISYETRLLLKELTF